MLLSSLLFFLFETICYHHNIPRVSDVPKLVASKITMANLGDTVALECMVDAHPEPKMMFWRDAQGRTPVIQSGKHNVNVIRSKEDYTKFVMELTISKLTETDDGDYFCHAENSFGSSTKPVSVRIRNTVSTTRRASPIGLWACAVWCIIITCSIHVLSRELYV